MVKGLKRDIGNRVVAKFIFKKNQWEFIIFNIRVL